MIYWTSFFFSILLYDTAKDNSSSSRLIYTNKFTYITLLLIRWFLSSTSSLRNIILLTCFSFHNLKLLIITFCFFARSLHKQLASRSTIQVNDSCLSTCIITYDKRFQNWTINNINNYVSISIAWQYKSIFLSAFLNDINLSDCFTTT